MTCINTQTTARWHSIGLISGVLATAPVAAAPAGPVAVVISAPAQDLGMALPLAPALSVLIWAPLLLAFILLAAALGYCIWQDARAARQSAAVRTSPLANRPPARADQGWRAAPYLAFASVMAMVAGHALPGHLRPGDRDLDGRKTASQMGLGKSASSGTDELRS